MTDLTRTGINDEILEKLVIAEYHNGNTDDRFYEIMEDANWLNNPVVYPPRPEFLEFWNLMIGHMKRVWTCVETDLKSDIYKFKHAPQALKSIVSRIIGLFILGDTVVLAKLKNLDLTPNVVRMFLDNQTDRENTHQLTYSMWADILDDPNYVRSNEFVEKYLNGFQRVGDKYKHHTDNRVILFFIMVCEMIFFVPGFQVLCYLATTGYAPNLCNANMLVMRDEHMHYLFARKALASYTRKLDRRLALEILHDMVDAVDQFIKMIASEAQHPVLSEEHLLAHLHYVVHQFKLENSLYDETTMPNDTVGSTTPAWEYMFLLKYQTKTNLMESVSTNYKIPGPLETNIDMSFDL